MKRVLIAIAALVVLGPPEGGHYMRAEEPTPAGILLRPTDHPRVPVDVSMFWMAPEKGSARTAAQANLATAVKFEEKGEHTKALTLLLNPATKQDGPLAAYAEFYKGLAQLHLGRNADARATFQGLQVMSPVGFLSEVAALREAECDEALNDQAAALAVYERLAATKTMAPDAVLMKLGKAALAVGADDKAQAAFERVYYDYPLSDLADDAAEQLDDMPVDTSALRFKQDLARAERLFAAKQYPSARSSFEKLRSAAQGDDRTLIQLPLSKLRYDETSTGSDSVPVHSTGIRLRAFRSSSSGMWY